MAILLMASFHIVFDLNEFAGIDIDYLSGFWYWAGKASALAFIFLAGISSGFSNNTIKRGVRLLAFAIVITIVTYIAFREEYIRFGILHFLGISMVLSPLLKKFNNALLLISAIVIAVISLPLGNTLAGTSLLLPFGVMYRGFETLDYYPLIPYLSVFMIGIFVYKIYYYRKQSLFKLNYENQYISTISKNSLLIYLLHQPIIAATIFLLNRQINI